LALFENPKPAKVAIWCENSERVFARLYTEFVWLFQEGKTVQQKLNILHGAYAIIGLSGLGNESILAEDF